MFRSDRNVGNYGRPLRVSIIPHTLAVQTTNMTYYVILLEYVDESQVNVHVV